MGKYKKRADKPVVVIPGVGALTSDQVIEGDYDRFVPGLLEVVKPGAPVVFATTEEVVPSVADTEPAPPELDEEPEDEPVGGDQEPEEDEEEEEPDMSWKKDELVQYCDDIGIEREGGETKRELIHLIEEVEGEE